MTHGSKLKRTLLASLLGLSLVGTAACANAQDKQDKQDKQEKQEKKDQKAPAAKQGGQTVEMKVTAKGFEPAAVTVKKGQPVTLVITRTVERTCATEIIIDDTDINTKLPLNTKVVVTFTPSKAGQLKYGCAMGKMIGGVLTVQ